MYYPSNLKTKPNFVIVDPLVTGKVTRGVMVKKLSKAFLVSTGDPTKRGRDRSYKKDCTSINRRK